MMSEDNHKALDNFIESLESELRVGGAASLDELFNLALAIKEDLDNKLPEGEA